MGLTMQGQLHDLFPDFVEEAAREIATRTQEEMKDGVERRTPTAKVPFAYHGDVSAWIKDRRGRKPGTLRDRWEAEPVEHLPNDVYRAGVVNRDPIASLVEDDTRPHTIRSKKPTGVLRFPQGMDFIFRTEVHHPGTEGVHMMRDTLAVTEARWQQIANEVLNEIAQRESFKPVPVG